MNQVGKLKHKLFDAEALNATNLSLVAGRLGAGLALAVALLTLPGCVSVGKALVASNAPVANKVYRLKVYNKNGFLDKNGYERPDSGKHLYTKYPNQIAVFGGKATPEQILPYRYVMTGSNSLWEGVTLFNSGNSGFSLAHVNAEVPLLREGDLVDVYIPDPWVMKNQRYATVIRLVCLAEDKACAERAKSSKGRATGWVVLPKGQFDERLLNITPQMDLNGSWLPGKEPKRPPLPEGVAAEAPKTSAWAE